MKPAAIVGVLALNDALIVEQIKINQGADSLARSQMCWQV
jgi:hypothetical protein